MNLRQTNISFHRRLASSFMPCSRISTFANLSFSQNPPSIPTLAIAQMICFLRHTRLIIDWHNFGYTILALKLGSSHPMVRASRWYERVFSQGATAHFSVTNAMARDLKDGFLLQSPILPLHDRPAAHFQPIKPSDRAASLGAVLPISENSAPILNGKTRLLVSSTSWTPDEDFSILIEALCIYSEKALSTHPQLPEILAIITGKGPQKEAYLRQIRHLEAEGRLEMARIRTAWLSIEDYATLLASADLGISLHTSSSGVDLPMKVVDMFGAGLPVIGWDQFEAWPELVTEGVSGRGFSSAEGLVDSLIELFGDDGTLLARLREGALLESRRRWNDEWDAVAGKLLELTE
jgi:beta-1,4-mannosyltransferase